MADRVSCGCEAGREDAVPTGADAGTGFDFGKGPRGADGWTRAGRIGVCVVVASDAKTVWSGTGRSGRQERTGRDRIERDKRGRDRAIGNDMAVVARERGGGLFEGRFRSVILRFGEGICREAAKFIW